MCLTVETHAQSEGVVLVDMLKNLALNAYVVTIILLRQNRGTLLRLCKQNQYAAPDICGYMHYKFLLPVVINTISTGSYVNVNACSYV